MMKEWWTYSAASIEAWSQGAAEGAVLVQLAETQGTSYSVAEVVELTSYMDQAWHIRISV